MHRTLRLLSVPLLLGASLPASPQDGLRLESPPAAHVGFAERERAEEVRRGAVAAYRAQRYPDAAALYERYAGLPGARGQDIAHYQAACAYALAHRSEQSFAQLEQAMRAGFRHPDHLHSDPDLAGLHEDARWPAVAEAARQNLREYRQRHADPDRSPLVVSDLRNLGRALEAAATAPDPAARTAALREHYLEHASPGLLDFYFSRMESAQTLAEVATERFPRYFASLPELATRIAAEEPRIRAAFRRLKAIYPEAHFPPVYFVVGHLRSGGTVSESGLLVGVEVFGVTEGTPTDEFAPRRVPIIHPFAQLPHVVVHELIHLQQSSGGANTLLVNALREGGADFLAELILLERPEEFHYTWGEANEERVWERFSREMHGSDVSAWIGNNHTATDDWPAALGYFVGNRIARAFYERAPDKGEAVRRLLQLEAPESILRESGYPERFRR